MAYKIQKWALENIPESQNGFRWHRGTGDSYWNLTQIIRARKRKGLDTWVAFIDLKTAFDKVSRAAIFEIMRKFGFPKKFISALQRLHTNAKFAFKMGTAKFTVDNNSGVRQGDTAGPTLFLIAMMAVVRLSSKNMKKLEFTPQASWVMLNNVTQCWNSMYADDTAILADSRENLSHNTQLLIDNIFKITGMETHYATTVTGTSKSKAMFFPAKGSAFNIPPPLSIKGHNDSKAFIPFVPFTKYLGSIIHWNVDFKPEVETRRKKALKVTFSIKKMLNDKNLKPEIKGKLINLLILPVLLFNSEAWVIGDVQTGRLKQTWKLACRMAIRDHQKSITGIMERLKVKPISQYIAQRKINWLGKIFRMKAKRLPRLLLMAEAHQKGTEQNEHANTSTNTSNTTQNQPPPISGSTQTDKTLTLSVHREPPLSPDRKEETPQISQPSTSMEWIHQLSKATPPITAPRIISMIQSSELKWDIAKGARKCIIAKMKIISKNDICLTATQKHSNNFPKSISLGGVIALTVQMGYAWLEGSKESIKSLPEGLSEGVRYLLGDEARRVIANAKGSVTPLTPPTIVPWTCARCGKAYKNKLKSAKDHAQADICREKRRSGPSFFAGPCKSITQKQTKASKWQTKWSDQVAEIAISCLCLHNSLHLLVSNPLCQKCFGIKDQLNATSKTTTATTSTAASTTTIKTTAKTKTTVAANTTPVTNTTTATSTNAAASTSSIAATKDKLTTSTKTTAAATTTAATTTTNKTIVARTTTAAGTTTTAATSSVAATTTAAATTTSTPGTHLPCGACIFSCLAPIAIDDLDTWTRSSMGGKNPTEAMPPVKYLGTPT